MPRVVALLRDYYGQIDSHSREVLANHEHVLCSHYNGVIVPLEEAGNAGPSITTRSIGHLHEVCL